MDSLHSQDFMFFSVSLWLLKTIWHNLSIWSRDYFLYSIKLNIFKFKSELVEEAYLTTYGKVIIKFIVHKMIVTWSSILFFIVGL